ncbi:MAG: hypothetical protein NVS1B6_15810 [Steroidobacteraceae bacterium]
MQTGRKEHGALCGTQEIKSVSIPNDVDLARLREMTAQEAAGLPVDLIARLLEDATEIRDEGQAHLNKLHDALSHKYGRKAAALRAEAGKDTGRVSVDDGEYVVRADLPKAVEWDQALLTKAVQTIRDEWGEKPGDYVKVKIVVEEKKFEAWPPAIRKLFEPARTLGTGKPSFKLERRAES